jgi:O-acetyl-ADP-ribose deacetylase (regulator of RNase III)
MIIQSLLNPYKYVASAYTPTQLGTIEMHTSIFRSRLRNCYTHNSQKGSLGTLAFSAV